MKGHATFNEDGLRTGLGEVEKPSDAGPSSGKLTDTDICGARQRPGTRRGVDSIRDPLSTLQTTRPMQKMQSVLSMPVCSPGGPGISKQFRFQDESKIEDDR